MTDEAEFAMKYAEERKKVLKLEERLASLMYEIIPYVTSVEHLIDAVIRVNPERMAPLIQQLVEWTVDIESNLHLNIMRPGGNLDQYTDAEIQAANSMASLPRDRVNAQREYLETANKAVHREWNAVCREFGFNSKAKNKMKRRNAIIALTDEMIEGHANGERQTAETH